MPGVNAVNALLPHCPQISRCCEASRRAGQKASASWGFELRYGISARPSISFRVDTALSGVLPSIYPGGYTPTPPCRTQEEFVLDHSTARRLTSRRSDNLRSTEPRNHTRIKHLRHGARLAMAGPPGPTFLERCPALLYPHCTTTPAQKITPPASPLRTPNASSSAPSTAGPLTPSLAHPCGRTGAGQHVPESLGPRSLPPREERGEGEEHVRPGRVGGAWEEGRGVGSTGRVFRHDVF